MFYLCLCFPQIGWINHFFTFFSDNTIVIGSYLAIVERKITLFPFGTPSVNECRKHIRIGMGTIPVILTLIPDDSFHGQSDQWVQHTIIQYGWSTVLWFDICLRPGYLCIRKSFQPVGSHPSFASRTTPGCHYQAYRNIQYFIYQPPEVIGCRTEITHCSRTCLFPGACHIILRSERRGTFHCE